MKRDNKKIVAEFIKDICDFLEKGYKEYGHDGFRQTFKNDKMSYLLADKGIEKRIERKLKKKLNIDSEVVYKLTPSQFKYLDAELNIRLIKYEHFPYIQLPKQEPKPFTSFEGEL